MSIQVIATTGKVPNPLQATKTVEWETDPPYQGQEVFIRDIGHVTVMKLGADGAVYVQVTPTKLSELVSSKGWESHGD